MKINLNTGITEREATIKSGSTVISSRLIREREMLDVNGNVIDPRTKQIIRLAEA
jgi:hypothetical protein